MNQPTPQQQEVRASIGNFLIGNGALPEAQETQADSALLKEIKTSLAQKMQRDNSASYPVSDAQAAVASHIAKSREEIQQEQSDILGQIIKEHGYAHAAFATYHRDSKKWGTMRNDKQV